MTDRPIQVPDDSEDPEDWELEEPLYEDPFAGVCAACRALPKELRDSVTQYCPRCGSLSMLSAHPEAAECLLEGMDLDQLALDSDDGALEFLALVKAHKATY